MFFRYATLYSKTLYNNYDWLTNIILFSLPELKKVSNDFIAGNLPTEAVQMLNETISNIPVPEAPIETVVNVPVVSAQVEAVINILVEVVPEVINQVVTNIPIITPIVPVVITGVTSSAL